MQIGLFNETKKDLKKELTLVKKVLKIGLKHLKIQKLCLM